MKALTTLLNQSVSGKNAGGTIEIKVRVRAGKRGINPMTIKYIDTLPIEARYI
jgi:hypothetical protein